LRELTKLVCVCVPNSAQAGNLINMIGVFICLMLLLYICSRLQEHTFSVKGVTAFNSYITLNAVPLFG